MSTLDFSFLFFPFSFFRFFSFFLTLISIKVSFVFRESVWFLLLSFMHFFFLHEGVTVPSSLLLFSLSSFFFLFAVFVSLFQGHAHVEYPGRVRVVFTFINDDDGVEDRKHLTIFFLQWVFFLVFLSSS